ncbi:MAG: hypothetical protein ACRDDX_02890 [Cellulosilyticaceae bacterium]
MYQSSNMFMPHSCDCCEAKPCHCPCQDAENYYGPACRPCACHKPCPCPEPCVPPCHSACDCCCKDPCYDPENYYCAKDHCLCDSPSCCCENTMTNALAPYLGKQVIICIGNTRMRVLVCGICGSFVKVLSIKCGRNLFINACKITSVTLSC